MTKLLLSTVRTLQARALASGGIIHPELPTVVTWDISGRCERPVPRTIHSRGFAPVNPGSATLEIKARCRQCPRCLGARSQLWRERATIELNRANRSWFATFTMSPSEHHLSWMRIVGRTRARNNGLLPVLDVKEEFLLRSADMGQLLTKYFKRLRKETGEELRYCLVCERHESGLPHFHALIHEPQGTVSYRALQGQWPHGFTHFKLVNDDASDARKASRYVSKYISKSALVRIRASIRYGGVIRPRA